MDQQYHLPTLAECYNISTPDGFWAFWADYFSKSESGRMEIKNATDPEKWKSFNSILWRIVLMAKENENKNESKKEK